MWTEARTTEAQAKAIDCTEQRRLDRRLQGAGTGWGGGITVTSRHGTYPARVHLWRPVRFWPGSYFLRAPGTHACTSCLLHADIVPAGDERS
jgi:hypothetical protein